ncbi:Endothelin-converting enzyme 2 [Mortierella sp. GBA35]|nr:Endothelin-converting enzyme 2 [Mortierella sp. GBA35]
MISTKIFVLMAIGAALSVVRTAPVTIPNEGVLTNQDTCTTPNCVATATGIYDDMNSDADPCEDFSQFTCGGFYAKVNVTEENPAFDFTNRIRSRNSAIIRAISDPALGQSPTPAPGDTAAQSNLKKLHDLFTSCMDEKEIQRRGRKPLVDEINRALSLLPDVSATMDKTGLAKAFARLIKLQTSPIVTLSVYSHLYNPDVNVIRLRPAGLSMDLEKYNQTLPDSAALAKDIASKFQAILGPEPTNTTTSSAPEQIDQKWIDAAAGVVKFEASWAQALLASPAPTQTGDAAESNPWTIAEMNTVTPSINWNVLVSELLPAGETYTRPIYSTMLDPFHGLETVLKAASTETLRNYVAWRIISDEIKRLGAPYYTGPPSTKRWEVCLDAVHENLGEVAGHYFVENTLPGNSKIVFKSMIDSVLSSYGEAFQTLDWLDQSTRDNALKKLHAIVEMIAESSDAPNTESSASLEEYYRNYTVDASDYFGNLVRNSLWFVENNFAMVNKSVNREMMNSPPDTINAFYGPNTNEIYFPAGMLQPPFFHVDNPEYMNYGGMGVVAGHEIGWWSPSTEKAFEDKSQCIVDQYSAFTVKGPDGKDYNVDGKNTLGENIADNGGIKYAYRAWEKAYKLDPIGTSHKNFKLPGLEKYTPEQMFFISYGRIWCAKLTPKVAQLQLTVDVHSPAKWRIIGSLQSSPDFSRAFNCKAGTPMNPVKKSMVSTKLFAFMAIGAALSVVNAAPVRVITKGVLTNQDFSEFTCGGFYSKTKVTLNKPAMDTLRKIQERNSAIIRAISDPAFGQSPTPAAGDSAAQSNLKKLHDIFSSCMDDKEIERRGCKPLIDEIHSVVSSLPDARDKSSLTMTIAKLIKLQIKPFVSLSVDTHLYNPYNVVSQFQTILGAESTHTTTTPVNLDQKWTDAATGVVEFETSWAQAIIDSPNFDQTGQAANFLPWTIADMNAVTPSIDWNLLMSELLPAGETYTRSIIADQVDTLHGLETVLKATSTATLRNYFAWRIISAHNTNLGAPFNTAPTSLERWKFCVGVINENLGDLAGHYFVDMTMPGDSKIYFKSMVNSILASYGEAFRTLDWFDQPTRDNALKKLHAIVSLIAESSDAPNTASSESLKEYYRNYTVDETDYFGNLARRSVWMTATNFAGVNKPVNRNHLSDAPQTANAFYSPWSNQMSFPAGYLQWPYFHHGFNDSGKDYDYSGNYTNWWTPATAAAFEAKSKCIVYQYNAFTIIGPNEKFYNVSGQLTLGENIADIAGIKNKHFKLKGLEQYTPEQMFFISSGLSFCEKRSPQSQYTLLVQDSHSPAYSRIMGPLQNSPDFARAFNCKPNTPMNPINKCELF